MSEEASQSISEVKGPLTNLEYRQYGYHRHVVMLLDECKVLTDEAQKKLNESREIKKRIEDELWKTKEQQDLLKQKPTDTTAIEPGKTQTSKEIINGFETIDAWLTCINIFRIDLGVIRNIFTFCLQNNYLGQYTKDINRDSSLLASYLYPIRLFNELLKVFTYARQNATTAIPFFDVISGYYKAHWKKFINDCVWTLLLLFLNLSVYIQDAAYQAFIQNSVVNVIISFVIAAGFLFDVFNEMTVRNKLERDYKRLIDELGEGNIPDNLQVIYEKKQLTIDRKISELCCYFGLFLFYALFDLAEVALKTTPIFFSWIDFALTVAMFFIRVYFITVTLRDSDFKDKTPEEQMKIQIEVYSKLALEVLKIVAMAVVIFCIASTIPYGGLPAMLTIGVIVFALITFSNLMTKGLIEPYIIKPLVEWQSSNSQGGSSPAPTAEATK